MSATFKPYYKLPCGGKCPTCGGALVRMRYGGGIICRDWRTHGPKFGGFWQIVTDTHLRWQHLGANP